MLQGAWPGPMVWAVLALWIGASLLLLSVLVRRSRDQLVDWL